MGLTLNWSRVAANANVKKVRTRRINNETKRLLYNRVCHLLTPPALVRKDENGEEWRMVPALKRRPRKLGKPV